MQRHIVLFFHPEQVDIPPHQLPRDGGACNARADEQHVRRASGQAFIRLRHRLWLSLRRTRPCYLVHRIPAAFGAGCKTSRRNHAVPILRTAAQHQHAALHHSLHPPAEPLFQRTVYFLSGIRIRLPFAFLPILSVGQPTDFFRFQDSTRRRECQCTVCTGNVNFL